MKAKESETTAHRTANYANFGVSLDSTEWFAVVEWVLLSFCFGCLVAIASSGQMIAATASF